MSTTPVSTRSRTSTHTSTRSSQSGLFSVEADVPKVPGEGKPRRHPMVANGDFICLFKDDVRTLYDTFRNAVTQYGENDFLGWRPREKEGFGPYKFMTYREVEERVVNFAAGLASFNLGEKSHIGLYAINRPEWVLAEYACYYNNFVTVPLYDTLGDEAIEHIVGQSEMSICVVSNDKVNN